MRTLDELGVKKGKIIFALNKLDLIKQDQIDYKRELLNLIENEKVRVTETGVGIGTTNPTSKLTVRGGDISVGVNTSHGVILTSPNGTQYRLIVDDSGNLSTVLVP